jgi:hypothetical protein
MTTFTPVARSRRYSDRHVGRRANGLSRPRCGQTHRARVRQTIALGPYRTSRLVHFCTDTATIQLPALELQDNLNLSILLISHDLNMARHICHRIAVLYRGRIVELAPTGELFERPLHPYTKVLLSSIRRPDPARERERRPTLMDYNFDYSEPTSDLTEVSPGHFLAAARASVVASALTIRRTK